MVLNKLKVQFENYNEARIIIGQNDMFLSIIEKVFNVTLVTQGEEIKMGPSEEGVQTKIENLLYALKDIVSQNYTLTDRDIIYLANMAKEDKIDEARKIYLKRHPIVRTNKGKTIYAKSINQIKYLNQMQNKDLTFSFGPAGTGKTYLAVLFAVSLLKESIITKIILTRPAVEAGESLGFLPGDLKEKVDPYLQPLYDALYEALDRDTVEMYIEKGIIEIAPLAYMRGRTLSNAFIILDEAQNTTEQQMKMFLTRLGTNSKMVVTGDITQIDLPQNKKSGLVQAAHMLADIDGVGVMEFTRQDVVRHPLVQEILKKYEDNLK